ncbi:hypothetical protein CR513_39090, partial [Mucuna pruriens]
MKDHGIIHELTYINTLQQNEVVKQENHHLLKVAKALLFQMCVAIIYSHSLNRGDDEIERLTLKERLEIHFRMKELGKLKYFLRIDVVYSRNDIFISQTKYVLDLLKETGKLGRKTTGMPIEQNHKIKSKESPLVEKSQY